MIRLRAATGYLGHDRTTLALPLTCGASTWTNTLGSSTRSGAATAKVAGFDPEIAEGSNGLSGAQRAIRGATGYPGRNGLSGANAMHEARRLGHVEIIVGMVRFKTIQNVHI
jgi:hypothetical protein